MFQMASILQPVKVFMSCCFVLVLLQPACLLWKHWNAIHFQMPKLKLLITGYYQLTCNYWTEISDFKIVTLLNVLMAIFDMECLSNCKHIVELYPFTLL